VSRGFSSFLLGSAYSLSPFAVAFGLLLPLDNYSITLLRPKVKRFLKVNFLTNAFRLFAEN